MTVRSRFALFAILTMLLGSLPVLAATITVTNNNDAVTTGDGVSLREAVQSINAGADANADVTANRSGAYGTSDAIGFNIVSGAQTITISSSPLPTLVKPVVINGYTQPGSSPNSATTGDNSIHLITIDGTGLPAGGQTAYAFRLGAGSDGSTIRGLVITDFVTGGILLQSSNNTVAGNFIGTDAAGTATTVGNGTNDFRGGIFAAVFAGNGDSNHIGSSAPADRNVISGNQGPGVTLGGYGGTCDNNVVEGNYFGTNAAGTAALITLNPGAGVFVQGANGSIIGGTTGVTPGGSCTGSCNLISGTSQGVEILGNGGTTDTNNNLVEGNFIGTDVTGTVAIGNKFAGVYISQTSGPATIGGTTAAARNVISGTGASSSATGIDVENGGADPATVITIEGNYVGTNSAGTAGMGNGWYGIYVRNTSKTVIGGTTGLTAGACTGACNVIAGNGLGQASTGDGIFLDGGSQSTVQGNFIGVLPDGTALGNFGEGVKTGNNGFGNASDNVIGASTSGGAGGNIIANNGGGLVDGSGVKLTDFGGVNNKILSNSIYGNAGTTTSLAIDILSITEPTANDSCDPDNGPNHTQNYPVLTSAVSDGAQTTVVGTLNSTASQTFTVEFFANPAGDPQARTFLGSTTVNTDGACDGAFNTTLPTGAAGGDVVTATATDSSGNTSEVSASVVVTMAGPTVSKSFNASTVAIGAVSTMTITLSNANATAITGAAFTDTYPALLINGTPANGATTCAGGSVTAMNGVGSVGLSGATIPAGGSCTVTVSVLSNTAGSYTNTIAAGDVTSSNAASNTSGGSATLTVLMSPTVTKSFTSPTIPEGGTSTLTITLANANAVPLTSAAFTDNYPSGVVNDAPANGATTCGGTVTAADGGSSVALSGGTIPAGGNCSVTVIVTAASSGIYTNSIGVGALNTTEAGANTVAASADLTVTGPPTVAKSFAPPVIAPNGTSTLTVTLTNPNGTAATSTAFTDTYPSGITNAASPAAATDCGGVASATAGGNTLSLSGGTIPASGSCTVTVTVTGTASGNYTNTIGAGDVMSSVGANSSSAGAILTINAPPAVSKAFSPSPVGTGIVSTLTITLSNTNPLAITGTAFTDNYPPGLINASSANGATTCAGGSVPAANGGASVGLSGATIPASGSCTVTVSVLSNSAGSYDNTIAAGDVISGNAPASTAPAAATLSVLLPPTVSKSFTNATIAEGGTSTLTITLANANAVPLTSAAFTDNYPSGFINDSPANGATTCGGTVTAANGGSSVSLSNGTIPAAGNCTVTVIVTAPTSGIHTNSIGVGALTTNEAGANTVAASADLTVTGPPTVAKSFAPSNMAPNSTSTLTVTLTNPNGAAATSAAFTDTYPSGITNAASPAATTDCGGGIAAATAGGNTLSLSGGTIPAFGSCTVTVIVTGTTPGDYTNTIDAGGLTSSEGSNSTAASATLTINAPPIVSKAFNPPAIGINGVSTLTITLTNPNTAAITGVSFTDTYLGNLVNATPPAATTTCGGSVTAAAGGGFVALSGGTIPASGSCSVTVNVTSTMSGSYGNFLGAGSVTTANAGSNAAAGSATLTVSSSIPTLSGWVLLLLTAFLGGIAVAVLRR